MSDSDLKDIFNAAAGTPSPGEHLKDDQKDLKFIFQQAHDSPNTAELADQIAQNPKPGIINQSIDFAKNFPQSAIDLIPGMKEQHQKVMAERELHKNDIAEPAHGPSFGGLIPATPARTQGQEQAGFEQAGQDVMNDPGMAFMGAVGPSSAIDLAKEAGQAGMSLIGKIPVMTKMAPKLEVGASKMAQEAMGMNSSKDLTSEFNPMTGKAERGSDVIKDTGTTAMDQGVLKGGTGKWYDNALDALDQNYKKLDPLMQSGQEKLSQNPQQFIESIGPITTKTPQIVQNVFDEVPESSQRSVIVRKIGQQYDKYAQKLEAADGNLSQLNQIKRELQTAAENLSPQIYNNGSAKAEATLYKRLGGVVRQHIEDLASAADPGMGNEIHQVNKTIGKLQGMLPSLQKTTRGGLPTSFRDIGKAVVGPLESFAAKSMAGASKAISTPIGPIEQIPQASKTALVRNPFAPVKTENKNEQDSTYITRILANATPESLKDIAQKFQKEPALKSCGEMLNKAIMNEDNDAKNRAIFCAAQINKARQLLGGE